MGRNWAETDPMIVKMWKQDPSYPDGTVNLCWWRGLGPGVSRHTCTELCWGEQEMAQKCMSVLWDLESRITHPGSRSRSNVKRLQIWTRYHNTACVWRLQRKLWSFKKYYKKMKVETQEIERSLPASILLHTTCTVVWWLLLKVHCPKSISVTILTSNVWEDTRPIWCLSYASGGAPLIPGHFVSW